MVGIKKEPATQALALSWLRHRRSSTGVEQSDPNGRTRTQRRSLKKTEINPEEDASETLMGRKRKPKTMQVHTGQRRADSDRR
jgi:hypothetical protein